MTQMITSTTNPHNDRQKKATMNSQEALGLMHDHHNNTYHSSLYRHQVQSRQQHHRSATATNLITSSHSCGSPSSSPLSLTAADSARPHSTPSCYSHSKNNYIYPDDDPLDTHCIDHSVDFNSLCDSMDGSCNTMSQQRRPVIDGHDSFDAVLSYLRKNDELVQQMDEIEQLENLSFLRVMYLGVASAEEKHLFLKKLSDGLSESLFRQTPAPPPPPSTKSASDTTTTTATSFACGFRERKHHLLPLHLFLAASALDDDYYHDHAAMFEDNGVSIVEADFTTDSSMTDLWKRSPEMILRYIYTQYQQYCTPSTLSSILNLPPQWANQPFDGHVFSEGAPNGIDLCVYFYHDAQKMTDVTQDMDLLWKINTLGIPVLPIMSMSNQTASSPSGTTNEPLSTEAGKSYLGDRYTSKYTNADNDSHDDNSDNSDSDSIHESVAYVKQRPIDVRRNELAYIFSQWRIKMMDISNLDIIGQPSFQQKGNSGKRSTQQDMEIEQRLGQAWAMSSMMSPTPYHILTLFQFMAMDRWAVSKLLKTIQDQAEERSYSDRFLPAASISAKRNDNDIHHAQVRPLRNSSTHTETKSRQQVRSSHAIDDLTSTTSTAFQLQDNKNHSVTSQYDDHTTQGPTRQLQKERTITIHLWLLYTLPLLVLLLFGIWVALTGLVGGIMTAWTHHQKLSSAWHASLIMVSHQSGKSMTLMVNVYDGQHQPRWAPEPPLLLTNLRLPPIASDGVYSRTWKETSTTSSPILTQVAPLLNKTHSLEGQYFYSILLPSCSLLNPDIDYTVQVKPSATLPATPGTTQGSPLQLPRYVLCHPANAQHQEGQGLVTTGHAAGATGEDPMENGQETRHLLEAWYHFRQYSRFYLMNSLKIVELIFTEGKEKN